MSDVYSVNEEGKGVFIYIFNIIKKKGGGGILLILMHSVCL